MSWEKRCLGDWLLSALRCPVPERPATTRLESIPGERFDYAVVDDNDGGRSEGWCGVVRPDKRDL